MSGEQMKSAESVGTAPAAIEADVLRRLDAQFESEVGRAQRNLVDCRYLAQIETSGNQSYVFATNRRRENVGASALLAAACTEWVEEAIHDSNANILFTTSGRAMLASTDRSSLEEVIERVTFRALLEAPGLTVTGAITEWGDAVDGETTRLGAAMRRLAEENGRIAGLNASAASRFHRLPAVAQCAVSAYPAECVRRVGSEFELASAVAQTKYEAGGGAVALDHQSVFIGWLRDWQALLPSEEMRSEMKIDFVADLESMTSGDEDGGDIAWWSVIHIDGSGVGQTFIDLAALSARIAAESGDNADLLHMEAYFVLSRGLEIATALAFGAALDRIREESTIPMVPLLVGGDDVTVICLGRDAIKFTSTYLRVFEAATAVVAARLQTMLGSASIPSNYSACAGIAIIKPHHPFHCAYDLAEELTSSAKSSVKRSVSSDAVIPSAYDFHLLSDSSSVSMASIRSQRRSGDGINLWGGPYVVGDSEPGTVLRTDTWLRGAVLALMGDDAARSGVMKVKESLFVSGTSAERMRSELLNPLLDEVLEQGELITELIVGDEVVRSCALPDAVDLIDLLETPLRSTGVVMS
jgi:hypothetical protein